MPHIMAMFLQVIIAFVFGIIVGAVGILMLLLLRAGNYEQ